MVVNADQRSFLESVLDGDEDHDDEVQHAAMDVLPSPPDADNEQKEAGKDESGDKDKDKDKPASA